MHGGHAGEEEPMGEMNLIPLIDIALTLLIIMMVTTAFVRKPGVSLKLPETVTREGAAEMSKDQTVMIVQDGTLFMDGQPLSDAEVQQRMLRVAQVNKEARILIKGDRSVMYARVMAVMDLVRQAGLTKVVLPTDPRVGLGLPAPIPSPAGAAPTSPSSAVPSSPTTDPGTDPGSSVPGTGNGTSSGAPTTGNGGTPLAPGNSGAPTAPPNGNTNP